MDRHDKIQHLLITHLLDKGHIELTLPDGMVLELGIVQENKFGELEKTEDYSWVIATQKNRSISMDSYNLALRYTDCDDKIIVEDIYEDCDGRPVKLLAAI